MQVTRKIMLGAAAMALPCAAVIMVSPNPASAAKSNVNGTGVVTCTKIKGTITFTPPLTNTGTAPEVSTLLSITLKSCTGGTPNPSKGTVNTNIANGTSADSCPSFFSAHTTPFTLPITWFPTSILPSYTNYAGYNFVPVELVVPFTGSGSTMPGSYLETSGTTMTIRSNLLLSQLSHDCVTGLKKLKITSGSTIL